MGAQGGARLWRTQYAPLYLKAQTQTHTPITCCASMHIRLGCGDAPRGLVLSKDGLRAGAARMVVQGRQLNGKHSRVSDVPCYWSARSKVEPLLPGHIPGKSTSDCRSSEACLSSLLSASSPQTAVACLPALPTSTSTWLNVPLHLILIGLWHSGRVSHIE